MTHFSYLVDLSAITAFDEQNGKKSSWVHSLPMGTYKHPIYGTISVDAERAKRFADSVNNRTRGIEPSINYNHNNADVAAGWGKKAEARADGVWMFVEWTDDAAKQILEKKYKYFSAEFEDEWSDPTGNKFTDVMFGGALTNRPYMKNLAPINLSEETYQIAFDLVSAATSKTLDELKGGTGVALSDDDVKKIVDGLAAKMATTTPPTPTPTQKLSEIPELKALAEENPLVKALMSAVETQNLSLADSAVKLKEAEITRKLSEFDRSKIVLSPVARQAVAQLAMQLPTELSESFWGILEGMKRSNTFLVELGEYAGVTANYGSVKTADTQLREAAKKLVDNNKGMSFSDAYDEAVRENPALYKRYRDELNAGVEN